MAEWLVSENIGEHRALLKDGHHVLAAQIDWPGELAPGLVEDALLVKREKGTARGRALFDSGEEALVDRLPREASEGERIRLRVTRSAAREVGRNKLAQARPTDEEPCKAPSLAKQLDAKVVSTFYRDNWAEVWSAAWEGKWQFPQGELTFHPTPAMTLIDIDGDLSPRSLALAAVEPLATAIGWMGLAGSIGIDFPTLADRADRKAVDAALQTALVHWPHERTAMNGFGFVQIVARMERPSLLHRLHFDRTGASARYAINHAAELAGPGVTQINAHPTVIAAMRDDWLAELDRRTARKTELKSDPALAISGWHAQVVQP
ncbi:ribonuclease [Aurantiacibacter sp. D1-12]|uniref:ribonuclease n=1 Tax=Aurantiacibacter sp. D1-12 TaxID=2993658 RepID=UPI00237CF997|nr:ribonuclease [Aurantiacibacter sp. D1-12]MDE1466250.1 ribonuclease [Aurantiacibacter sp. D1-12]